MLDPWFKLHQPIRHLIRWLYWPWGGYPVLRDAHAVFFLCEDERRRAREAFWLYDCHEFVVRFGTSGIPREIAGSVGGGFVEAHPLLRGKRLFTFLADHNPAEGIYTIVKAIESLFQMGVWNPESMRLVIAGNASGTTKDILRQILGKSRFDESVYLAGALREREMWCALRESEVFLRPSSYEICGKQVAKSLSAGTPVLMSTGVAIWKDIVNDGAGFAGDETAEGFSAMLRRWISLSDDEHDTFRLAARKCFEARYTLIGAAHTLTSAIYLLVGVHRDSRWDLKPLKPASELA
jgi:glycosyltransferase involved in cell wall biosynthesis